jgi:hypothetical protein
VEARVLSGDDGGCECKTQTGTRVTGLRGYKEGNGCRVRVLAGCEGLVGMVFHVPSATRHAAVAAAFTESSRPCFERGTLPTAPAPTTRSSERVRFFHGSTAARRQMGKWAR